MKRFLVTCLAVSFSMAGIAQDGGDKKVNVGLAYQVGMNFNKPGTNKIDRDGVGAQNAIGLNLNFNFNENIGFATGLEFDFESYKYTFNPIDGNSYYYFKDKNIIKNEDLGANADASLFSVTERKYKNIYVSIPTMLVFRTNAIGDFRYYGKFGARTSFMVKSSMNDEGSTFSSNDVAAVEMPASLVTSANATNEGMRVPYGNDAVMIRSALGIAGGAQWNFTGSTVLFAEIGFYYGLTPMHVSKSKKDDNMTLFDRNASNTGNDYFRLKASQTQLCFKIGILF